MESVADTTVPVQRPRARVLGVAVVGLIGVFAALVLVGRADFLAFHSVTEFLVAAVSLTIFSIAWHTRRLVDDDYLTVLGIAQLVVAGLTILHALTYNGMAVFPSATATTASQLWLVTRAVEAAGLVAAPAFIGRCLKRPSLALAAYSVPAAIAVYAIFAGSFPVTFVLGLGLTPFKISAEWIIVAGMVTGLWLLWRKRDRLDRQVANDLAAAIGFMIAAELTFMAYATLTDFLQVFGHILHLTSVYFIYRALVARSLENPFSVLFRRLAQREEALRQENHFSEGLNRIAVAIGSSLDSDDILDSAIVEATGIAGANGATVSVYEGADKARVLYAFGEPYTEVIGAVFDRSQAPHLFLSKSGPDPVAIADTGTDPEGGQARERFGTRSLLSIPLMARGRSTGVLTLHWTERFASVSAPRLMLFARKLGASLSLALANARLYEGEHRVAETLQNAMVTALKPAPGVEVGSVYRSAPGVGKIGGDFFDVFELDNGSVAFALGDVCGKGIEAAATSVLTRSTLRALAYRNPGLPGQVLAGANEALRRQLGPTEFVTAVFGVLDPADGTVKVGLAGHPEPIVCGRAHEVPAEHVRNPPLGVVAGRTFAVWHLVLPEGDALVLFSDGVIEARRGAELFGMRRAREVLGTCAGLPCQQIAESLLAAVEEFSPGGLNDDLAVLALRVAPGSRAGLTAHEDARPSN